MLREPAYSVAVEHDQDRMKRFEHLRLVPGEVDAEERQSRLVQLLEPQDAPWPFDDNDGTSRMTTESVVLIEHSTLGQPWREDPFPPVFMSQTTASVPNRPALRITETHSDTAFEHSRAVPSADLETSRCLGMDSLVSEKGVVWIELEAPAIGLESESRWCRGNRSSDRGIGADDFEQVACDLVIVDVVEPPDQLDEIAAALAPGEAVPEVPTTIDDEGRWIVTIMDRTGADEPVTAAAKPVDEAAMREEMLDADSLFEPSKLELGAHQRRGRFRFDEAEPTGTVLPKVSK